MKDTKAIGDRSLPVEIQAEGKLRNCHRNLFLRFAVCRPKHTSTTSTFRLGHKLSTEPTLHAPPRPLTIPPGCVNIPNGKTTRSTVVSERQKKLKPIKHGHIQQASAISTHPNPCERLQTTNNLLPSRSNLSSTSKSNITLLAAALCNFLAVRVWTVLSASCDGSHP
jgi:hypothetical protein